MLFSTLILLSSLCLAGAVPADDAESADRFMVELRVMTDGTTTSAPRMVVTEGEAASVGQAGGDGVAVGLAITSSGPGTARVLAEVVTPVGTLAPDQVVRLGEWTSVTQGRVGLELRVDPYRH
jgi:hypothetical protein